MSTFVGVALIIVALAVALYVIGAVAIGFVGFLTARKEFKRMKKYFGGNL